MNQRLEKLEVENRALRAELGRMQAPAVAGSGFVVELLGVPRAARIAVDGSRGEVAIRLRRAWRGLALLALAPAQQVGREELIRTLWPDADPARVRRNLPPTIYVLRRGLGDLGGWTPIEARGNHAQPIGRAGRIEVVDDPHLSARVHAGDVGQELESEVRFVVQAAHHVCDVLGADPDLGGVSALTDRIDQLITEGGFEASLKPAVRGRDSCVWARCRSERSGRCGARPNVRGVP